MKFDNVINEQDRVTISKEKEIKKEVKFIGSVKMQRGQKLFELDMKTRLITIANVEAVANIKGEIKRKLIIKENCLYAPAINVKNAERKFIKMLS